MASGGLGMTIIPKAAIQNRLPDKARTESLSSSDLIHKSHRALTPATSLAASGHLRQKAEYRLRHGRRRRDWRFFTIRWSLYQNSSDGQIGHRGNAIHARVFRLGCLWTDPLRSHDRPPSRTLPPPGQPIPKRAHSPSCQNPNRRLDAEKSRLRHRRLR